MISGSNRLYEFQPYSVNGGTYETLWSICFNGIDDRLFCMFLQPKEPYTQRPSEACLFISRNRGSEYADRNVAGATWSTRSRGKSNGKYQSRPRYCGIGATATGSLAGFTRRRSIHRTQDHSERRVDHRDRQAKRRTTEDRPHR